MSDYYSNASFDTAQTRSNDLLIGHRALAAWEIASVSLSFLIAEWIVFPFTGRPKLVSAVPIALAFLVIIASHVAHGETPRVIGLRLDNVIQATYYVLPAMLVAAAIIFLIGWHTGTLYFGSSHLKLRFIWLPVWGFAQQYVMQGFINRRAQVVVGRGLFSVLLVAIIFAVFHLPNPWLCVVTFLGGVVWGTVYQRAPNLLVLGFSHGIMSLYFVAAFPPSVLHGLRVGYKYFGYN